MARGCCFDVTLRASHAVALHSLMSAFQGACCLPGDNGFSSSVTCELELRCADSVNKRADTLEAARAEPAPLFAGCASVTPLPGLEGHQLTGALGSPRSGKQRAVEVGLELLTQGSRLLGERTDAEAGARER